MKTYFSTSDDSSIKKGLKILAIGLGLSLAITIVTLIFWVGKARNLSIGDDLNVALGPLRLMHIDKLAQGEGFAMVFSLSYGAAILAVICCILAALVVMGLPKYKK